MKYDAEIATDTSATSLCAFLQETSCVTDCLVGGFMRFSVVLLLMLVGVPRSWSAATGENPEVSSLDPAKLWITQEQDLLVPPGETEIYFASTYIGKPPGLGRLTPPAHCKLTLKDPSKSPRRIDASRRTPLAIKEIKVTDNTTQRQGVHLELGGQTLKSLDCMNTTYGFALSSGARAYPPTLQDVAYHLGWRFSFRVSDTASEDVVQP